MSEEMEGIESPNESANQEDPESSSEEVEEERGKLEQTTSRKSSSSSSSTASQGTADEPPKSSHPPNVQPNKGGTHHHQANHMVMHDDGIIDLDQNDLNYGEEEEEEDAEQEVIERSAHRNVRQEEQKQLMMSQNDISLAENMTAISSDSEADSGDETNKNGTSAAPVTSIANPNSLANNSNSQPVSDDEAAQDSMAKCKSKKKSKSKAKASPKSGDEEASAEDGEVNELEEGELETESDSDDSEIAVMKGSTGLSPPQPPNFPPQMAGFDLTRPPPMPMFATQVMPQRSFVPIKASERSPDVGVCKFYLRGACTWGEGCKFFHPPEAEKHHWMQMQRLQRPLLSNHNSSTYINSSGQRVIQTNLCKPIVPLLSIPNFGGNTVNSVRVTAASNKPEDAWERGLRQARELVNKKNSLNKSEGSLHSGGSIEDRGTPSGGRDSNSPPLVSPSAHSNRRSFDSNDHHSSSRNSRGGPRKMITAPSHARGNTYIPSLIDSMRGGGGSDSNSSYSNKAAPLLGELSRANRGEGRGNNYSRELSSQVTYPSKSSNRYAKARGNERSRSQSSGSEEDDIRASRKLKSLVTPVISSQRGKDSRPTLSSKNNDYSDPWVRRATPKSPSTRSGSFGGGTRNPRTQNIENKSKEKYKDKKVAPTSSSKHANNSGNCSPVSSGSHSTKTFPSEDEGKEKGRQRSRAVGRKKRGSSSSSSTSKASSSRSSSSSGNSRDSDRRRRRRRGRRGEKRRRSSSQKRSISPREKKARENFGSNTLRSLLANSESACRTGDLAAFKIPKKKQAASSDSDSDERKKRLFQSQKLSAEKFFETKEEDAPAAYQTNKMNDEKAPSSSTAKRARRSSSSSDSASSNSSASSNDNSSKGGGKRRRKGTKRSTPAEQDKKEPEERVPTPEAQMISSEDEEEGDKKNGTVKSATPEPVLTMPSKSVDHLKKVHQKSSSSSLGECSSSSTSTKPKVNNTLKKEVKEEEVVPEVDPTSPPSSNDGSSASSPMDDEDVIAAQMFASKGLDDEDIDAALEANCPVKEKPKKMKQVKEEKTCQENQELMKMFNVIEEEKSMSKKKTQPKKKRSGTT